MKHSKKHRIINTIEGKEECLDCLLRHDSWEAKLGTDIIILKKGNKVLGEVHASTLITAWLELEGQTYKEVKNDNQSHPVRRERSYTSSGEQSPEAHQDRKGLCKNCGKHSSKHPIWGYCEKFEEVGEK